MDPFEKKITTLGKFLWALNVLNVQHCGARNWIKVRQVFRDVCRRWL